MVSCRPLAVRSDNHRTGFKPEYLVLVPAVTVLARGKRIQECPSVPENVHLATSQRIQSGLAASGLHRDPGLRRCQALGVTYREPLALETGQGSAVDFPPKVILSHRQQPSRPLPNLLVWRRPPSRNRRPLQWLPFQPAVIRAASSPDNECFFNQR